jgi:twitching motility protein PilT
VFDLHAALHETIRVGASDLHLKVPSAPRVRVAGELADLPGYGPLSPEDTQAIKERVLTSEAKQSAFEEHGSADLSYFTGEARFRASAFSQRGAASFVFRVVPDAPDVDELGLPKIVPTWADAPRGLVVVTGPTGSGKSTTLAGIVDLVNRHRRSHIITIEDPIEFIHPDRRALVSQREIGLDAPNYRTALRAAMRQDPDVVLIGEVRDEETAMTALRAAETGHLVLCTLHTLDAAETVHRFVDLFGDRQTSLARQMMAATLVGICSQRLVPAVRGGRVLNSEVLINSSRMGALIAEGEEQGVLRKAIAEGEYYGMHTFDQDLKRLVNEGLIEESAALSVATDPHDFKLLLGDANGRGPTEPVAAAAPDAEPV